MSLVKNMKRYFTGVIFLFLSVSFYACKKKTNGVQSGCDSTANTIRQIVNKKAVIKVTGTATYPVYLVEEGSIDTKLVPCNFPDTGKFYQNDLQVIISGAVKAADPGLNGPCCSENFVISSITK